MSEEQFDSLDNGTAIGNIIETGDLEEARSILGDREKIRYAGIIRAGVKVPKKSCSPKELALFKKLEAEGLSYDEIDRQMGGEPKSSKSKLFPTNTDHFVIRPCDFRRESDVDYIMKHYADPDGNVRRIPIWLTVGDLDKVVPHNFREFDGSGNVKAYSFYEGKDLMLKYVPKNAKAPYKKEDWKVCPYDPDAPPSDAPVPKFGGLYKVNIPGLKGLGEIVVPTRSWYGLGDAVAQLRRVRSLLGRFNGLLNGEPFLELCKVEETVRTPDGKKQKQWVITIELSVDPMELARHADKLAERGPRALAMFNGGAPAPAATVATPSPQPAETEEPKEQAPVASHEPPAAETQQPQQAAAGETQQPVSERRQKCLDYMATAAKLLALEPKVIEQFAATDNFGAAVEDLSDDEIAKFCTRLRTSLTSRDPETLKADILAVVGQ